MKSKWRYNIRLAERRGIGVRQGGDDLAAFYRLYAETGERDGFLTRPFAQYRVGDLLRAEDDAANPAAGALLLAEHSEETAPASRTVPLRYGRRAWQFLRRPAANDAGVTCPTICCNGKPCGRR